MAWHIEGEGEVRRRRLGWGCAVDDLARSFSSLSTSNKPCYQHVGSVGSRNEARNSTRTIKSVFPHVSASILKCVALQCPALSMNFSRPLTQLYEESSVSQPSIITPIRVRYPSFCGQDKKEKRVLQSKYSHSARATSNPKSLDQRRDKTLLNQRDITRHNSCILLLQFL